MIFDRLHYFCSKSYTPLYRDREQLTAAPCRVPIVISAAGIFRRSGTKRISTRLQQRLMGLINIQSHCA